VCSAAGMLGPAAMPAACTSTGRSTRATPRGAHRVGILVCGGESGGPQCWSVGAWFVRRLVEAAVEYCVGLAFGDAVFPE
jgi:hypothetical protein